MAEKPPFITGWCNQQEGHPPALHHLCRQIYSSQRGDVTYTCTCPCHEPERVVKRVLRRKEA